MAYYNHMERVVSGLRSLIEGPLATGSDRAEELNGRGLEANRHGDTSAALGFFLQAHVRGRLDESALSKPNLRI